MQQTYAGAITADIHWGAMDAKIMFNELVEGFLKDIQNLAVLDYVIIAGDYFDSKLSMNSQAAKYGIRFLQLLVKVCIEKNAKLRIIKGTESHDNQQLALIDAITSHSNCDVKIFETVATEWLFEDLHVLYIPEEYMDDMDAYYADVFNDTYDMIIGHGLIKEALYFAAKQESESTMPRAPVFELEKLLSICRGHIFFGHIHKTIVIQDRFRYINSYTRWSFGEEEDKGYCMYFYNPSSTLGKVEFIPNKLARRFDTVAMTCDPNAATSEQEQIEYMLKLSKTFVVDYLRLEVTIPEEYPNPKLMTELITEVFAKYRNIKIKLFNNGKLRKQKEVEDQIKKLYDIYAPVFDPKLPPEVKLMVYIKIKYGRDIPIERMRKRLYEGISKGVLRNGA